MKNKTTTTTNKQILNICTPCLFTMRQDDESFDKALLGQSNWMFKVNNDRIET